MSTDPSALSEPQVPPTYDNPYQPPSAPVAGEPGPAASAPAGGRGFKPVRWASTAAIVGLLCTLTLAIFSVYVTLDWYWPLLTSPWGTGVRPTFTDDMGLLAAVSNTLESVVGIVTAIPFIIWFHRCYRNLAWLYVDGTKYSTGWAVGGWFIPFFNLVRPYQVAREIWDASNPDVHATEGPGGWLLKRSAHTVQVWWTFYIASSVVIAVAGRVSNQPSVEMLKVGIWFMIIGNIVNAIGAAAAILLIRRLNARQVQRHERLQSIFARHALAHLGPEQAT